MRNGTTIHRRMVVGAQIRTNKTTRMASPAGISVACTSPLVKPSTVSLAAHTKTTVGTLIEPYSSRPIKMAIMTPASAPIVRTSRVHARLPSMDPCRHGSTLARPLAPHSPRVHGARVARDRATQPAPASPGRHHASLARTASGRFRLLRCRPPAGQAGAGRRAQPLSALPPSRSRARRTDCFASPQADHALSSHSQPGPVTEFLLVMIHRSESPQLADDPFDRHDVTLPDCLPPFCNKLSGTADIGAFPDASGVMLEFPLPCTWVTKIRRRPQSLDDGQLPFDLVRVLGHERAFTGLVRVVQGRSLGIVAVTRDPAERHCEAFLDFPPKLRPSLLGLDLGEQGVEVRKRTARLLAGVEIAAVGGLDVLLGLVQTRYRGREPCGRLAGTVGECGTRKIGRTRSQLRERATERFERNLRRHEQRDPIEDPINARNARLGAELAAPIELEHQLDLGACRQRRVQLSARDLESADQATQMRPGELALHDRNLEHVPLGPGVHGLDRVQHEYSADRQWGPAVEIDLHAIIRERHADRA